MREPESQEDSALDRELQALLSVSPSPEFVARVQTSVSEQRPARSLYAWWFAGSLVAAAAAIIVAISMSTPNDSENTDTVPRLAVHADRDIEPPLVPSSPLAKQPDRQATSNLLARASRTSQPVVMVWHEDAEGLDELIKGVVERRFEIVGEGGILPRDTSQVSSADMAPIVFQPIEMSPIEGVFQ